MDYFDAGGIASVVRPAIGDFTQEQLILEIDLQRRAHWHPFGDEDLQASSREVDHMCIERQVTGAAHQRYFRGLIDWRAEFGSAVHNALIVRMGPGFSDLHKSINVLVLSTEELKQERSSNKA